jgi:SET family sugar efflux transporter-like MFS transporter
VGQGQKYLKLLRLPGFTPMAIAMFVLGTALSFTAPYVSLYGVNHAHMSPGRLGLFMTMMAISGVVISRYMGKRSDAAPNRRPYVLAANFAAVFGYAGMGLTSNYWLIMILGCVFLGIAAATLPQMFSYSKTALAFTDRDEEDLGSAALRTLVSIAWVFGPSIGAILLSLLDFDGLFGIAAACFALAGLLVFRAKMQPDAALHHARTLPAAPLDSALLDLSMPERSTIDGESPAPAAQSGKTPTIAASRASVSALPSNMSRAASVSTVSRPLGATKSAAVVPAPAQTQAARADRHDSAIAASAAHPSTHTATHTAAHKRAILLAFIAFTLIGVSGAAVMIALPIYMVNVLHGNSHQVAMMFGWGALLEVPIMLGFGLSSKRLPKSKLIAAGAVIHVIYFIGIMLADSAEHLIPLQAANAFVVSVFSCLGMQYFQELMPGEPGNATTLFFNTNRVGAILAGVLAGWIAGMFGYRYVFVMCAFLSSAAFVLLFILARQESLSRLRAGSAKLAN